ncbi:MAG: arylsulfotransferase family protein, partial [Deltaproteobacteria bacterium]|nr:arylsulfotransferase family protein [Deltaproteobacteria bacterium]
MKHSLVKAYFLVSLVFISYFWGIITTEFQIFPYPFFNDAYKAYSELRKAKKNEEINPFIFDAIRKGKSVTIYEPDHSFPGNTFMTLLRSKRFEAVLVSPEGSEIHKWGINYSDVWPNAPHLEYQAPDHRISIHGALLDPNGDVIFNFDDGNFPTGGGLVKIDRCSKLLSRFSENTHHSIFRDDDGYLWVPSHVLHRNDDYGFQFIKPP